MKFNLSKINSPLGEMLLVMNQRGQLSALEFSDHEAHLHRNLRDYYGQFELVDATAPEVIVAGLQGYFNGNLAALDEISTATKGTELQRNVWAALRKIPFGQTISYGELARTLGYDDPRMAIEIGAANGANPIAIVVPCHRVIARNGDLKGYAWGVHRKRWLLEHEGALPNTPREISAQEQLPGF